MIVKDIVGLSAPLCKLIDVMSDGISAIALPWQIKRIENAKDKARLASSAIDREIAFKDELARQITGNLVKGRDLRELNNINDILGFSIEMLQEKKEVSDEPVDPDWSARFFDYAKNCSDDTVKYIWSQILAGEIENPGTYSLRTLDMLRNLSKQEAEMIVNYAHRAIDCWFATCSMPIFDVTVLGDIGFINDTDLFKKIELEADHPKIVHQDKDWVLIVSSKVNTQTSYQCKALSQAGREILSLVQFETNDEFLHDLSKEIIMNAKPKGLKVSKHKVLEDTKQYYLSPIWTEE